jgi:crotonobetainyl-CoA:carnitine CoA-transferase CaiB-like acyl-CoA transferase
MFSETRTGEADRPPSKVGVAATDIATGLYAHGAIMAALLSRQQTGKGVWIDCNLFESQVNSSSLTDCEQDHIRDKTRLQAWPILRRTT